MLALLALLQAKPALVDQLFIVSLTKELDENSYGRRRTVVMEALSTLLPQVPTLANQVLPWFARSLSDKDEYVRNAAMKALPLPIYIYRGILYCYLNKIHYSITTFTSQELTALAQSIKRNYPSWLHPIPLPTEFDEHIVETEISTSPQQADISQFGHTRRLLSISEEDSTADIDNLQESSASTRYDTSWLPWSWMISLGQHLYGYRQPHTSLSDLAKPSTPVIEVIEDSEPTPKTTSTTSKPPVSEEKVAHPPKVTLSCSVGSGGIDQQPVTLCADSDYTMYVFPKPSLETSLIRVNGQTAPPMSADSYDPHSCRPIEFYGRSSVFCEGENTMLVYTPRLSAPPLAQLDGNIMLGRVGLHILSSTYRWVQNCFSSWRHSSPTSPSMITTPSQDGLTETVLQSRLEELEESLATLEHQLAEILLTQRDTFRWLKFVVDEHRETLEHLKTHSHVRLKDLAALEQDLAASRQDMQEQWQSSQSRTVPISSLCSSDRFFALPPPQIMDTGMGVSQFDLPPLNVSETESACMLNSGS